MGTGDDMERYWGTYRSGYYLGMKTRSARSPIVGLMWMRQYVDLRSVHGDLLRHKCNQDNQLRYGWMKHDGVYFGEQAIDDNDLKIGVGKLRQSLRKSQKRHKASLFSFTLRRTAIMGC